MKNNETVSVLGIEIPAHLRDTAEAYIQYATPRAAAYYRGGRRGRLALERELGAYAPLLRAADARDRAAYGRPRGYADRADEARVFKGWLFFWGLGGVSVRPRLP